jgi:Peptidase family M1 domain
LDPATRSVRGQGTVRLINGSSQALSELYLHLYLNAFKQPAGAANTWPAGRSATHAAALGQIDVLSFVDTRTGQNLWPRAAFVGTPGPFAETDVRLPLTEPVAAGSVSEWTLEWRATLPGLTQRTGYVDDYYFVAQWFPKLAKLEADGTFAHFSFDPRGEFYADFGDYDITLTVPARFVVGASGTLTLREQLAGDLQRLRYRAEAVHDFAWTAWPDYLEIDRQIGETAVRLLFPDGYQAAAESSLKALEFGLPYFTDIYGPYPYRNITVVHPPAIASGANGMEYPTLITTGGTWRSAIDWGVYRDRSVELVTLHELAHQWFYGVVASNEARWPFLDEGLTSFAEASAAEAWLGPSSDSRWFGLSMSAMSAQRIASVDAALNFPVAQAAVDYPSFSDLGDVVYGRTATLLETLRRVYGVSLLRALGDYAEEFRFRHPTPDDLLGALEHRLGKEPAEQARVALFERGWVDYQLLGIDSKPALDGGLPGGNPDYRNRLTVARQGSLSFPLDIEWTATDGSKGVERWDGRAAAATLEFVSPAPVTHAWIDPDCTVLLDQNLLNNARTVEPQARLLGLENLVFWLAAALHWIGP